MPALRFHEHERLLNRYRQSGYILLRPLAVAIFLIGLPWYFLVKYELWHEFLVLLLIWTAAVMAWAARIFIVWWLNRYLVTDRRLIKMAHLGLFKKIVVETPLERILNVSYKTTGFTSVAGRYGDVEVQVVGLVEPIILTHISQPAAIKDYLWQLHQKQVQAHVEIDRGPFDHLQDRIGYTKRDQRIL